VRQSFKPPFSKGRLKLSSMHYAMTTVYSDTFESLKQVSKVIRQMAASPTCHPSRLRMGSPILTSSNTWFLGPTWVSVPNGISISSAVFFTVHPYRHLLQNTASMLCMPCYLIIHRIDFTSSAVGRRRNLISVSVCLSVCPLLYIKNQIFKFHQIFCTCYLWLWLCHALTAIQWYVLPVCGWRHHFT